MWAFVDKTSRFAAQLTLGRLFMALPLREDLVVYTCLWHRAPRGNPLAIYQAQLRLAPQMSAVWVVRREDEKHLPPGTPSVRPRSLGYLKAIATAGTIVDDANPVWRLPRRPGQVYLQTHHGTALKLMGADRRLSGQRPAEHEFTTLARRCQRWTYSVAASTYSAEVWRRAYGASTPQLLIGTPRNDVLVNAPAERADEVRKQLGVSQEQRTVLYMPTWRNRETPQDRGIGVADIASSLNPNDVMLVRDHYFHDHQRRQELPRNAIDVSEGWQVEDLYLAADILVTDYSSAMFDFLLVDRPIVILAHDWVQYRAERGVYFDLTQDAPGPVVTTLADLRIALSPGDDAHAATRRHFRERFCTFEDGHASERAFSIAVLREDARPYEHTGAGFSPPPDWLHSDTAALEPPQGEETPAPGAR